jgi:DNA polymerase-3 subunit epsilon
MKITRPICFFDLESTGVDTNKDRIVQIAMITIYPDGTSIEKDVLINPEIPIPLEAAEIHGITDEMVKDAPKFKQIAKSLVDQLEGCDMGGFNSDSYDINLLLAEMDRAGVDFSIEGRNLVDVMKLYRILYPNTLSDIYKRLIGKDLEGAHDALVDVKATKEILDKILPEDLETSEDIDLFCQGDKKRVDMAGKIYQDEKGDYRWNFSKNKDELVTADKGFCNWLLSNDFPNETKNKVREIIKPKENGK